MPHRRFDLKQAAAYLHISEGDLERLVHHGEIPCERKGDRVAFARKDIDAWASQRILGLTNARVTDYHKRSSARMHELDEHHAIIGELLHPLAIDPALTSRTKPSLLRDMVKLAEKTDLVFDPPELLATLEEREAMCSTALPGGCALLHPRHHDPHMFEDSFIALGRTVQPVAFGSSDNQPTDLFFLICCQSDLIHLHVLARLCVMRLQTSLLADLHAADDRDAMLAALAQSEDEVIRGL